MKNKLGKTFTNFVVQITISTFWLSQLAIAGTPVVCSGGNCGGKAWLESGQAEVRQHVIVNHANNIKQSVTDIDQASQNAVLNWESFNIDATNTVNFNQPDASSIALNKVVGQTSPSQILGNLNANGQVYIVNPNGIVFGEGAKVDVGSLVASSLDFNEKILTQGFSEVVDRGEAAFSSEGEAGKIVNLGEITAKESGKVYLFAPIIENGGVINTKSGQIIFGAAKDKVYLRPVPPAEFSGDDDDSNRVESSKQDQLYEKNKSDSLRGFLIEVGEEGVINNLGEVLAETGNITFAAMAINQNGTVRATTSTTLNGSVMLKAAAVSEGNNNITVDSSWRNNTVAEKGGNLTFGANGVTEIVPSTNSEEAIPSQDQLTSWLDAFASQITVESDATLRATSGDISLRAMESPQKFGEEIFTNISEANITIADSATLDASGDKTAVKEMSENFVDIQLTSNELKDSPLQRDGVLARQKITVDIREDTSIVNESGAKDNVKSSVNERLSEGGTIALHSTGSINVEQNAVLDVSGGFVTYEAGADKSSRLRKAGELVDIEKANKDVVYDELLSASDLPETILPGYTEGKDSGLVIIAGNGLTLNGAIKGKATNGVYQRDKNNRASAAEVVVDANQIQNNDYVVNFIDQHTNVDQTETDVFNQLDLAASLFDNEEINSFQLNVEKGEVNFAPEFAVELPEYGSFNVTANKIDFQGQITALGGDVSLTSSPFIEAATDYTQQTITLGDDSIINVSGNFINDLFTLAADKKDIVIVKDGGEVTLKGPSGIIMSENAVIDASGGVYVENKSGKPQLHLGKGGSVKLASGQDTNDLSASIFEVNDRIDVAGFSEGGKVSFETDNIVVSSQDPVQDDANENASEEVNTWHITPDELLATGAQKIELIANDDSLRVKSDVSFDFKQSVLSVTDDIFSQQSTDDVSRVRGEQFIPKQYQRSGVSLTLSSIQNDDIHSSHSLIVDDGASFSVDPNSTIEFSTTGQLVFSGDVDAKASTVSFKSLVAQPTGDDGQTSIKFDPSKGIWLSSNADIDTSGTFIQGQQPSEGKLYDGGEVNIIADQGYIEVGDRVDINLSGAEESYARDVQGQLVDGTYASNAGTLNINAQQGLHFNAAVNGAVNSALGANKAALNVTIDKESSYPTDDPQLNNTYPTGDQVLVIQEGSPVNYIGPNVTPEESRASEVVLTDDLLSDRNFDFISIKTEVEKGKSLQESVTLAGDVNLSAGKNFMLNTSDINVDGNATLTADNILIGTLLKQDAASKPALEHGNSSFHIEADTVDFSGNLQISGVEDLTVESAGDVRFRGVASESQSRLTGMLAASGNITLNGRQLYPTSMTDYTLYSGNQDDHWITVLTNGKTPISTYSANGSLTFDTVNFASSGVIKAPQGQLNIGSERTKQIELEASSVLSVALDQESIIIGELRINGSDWQYLAEKSSNEGATEKLSTIPQLKEKLINLDADQVEAKSGAVVDLSGGGEIFAYEFVAGPQGSQDVFAQKNTDESFAILPVRKNEQGIYEYMYTLNEEIGADLSQVIELPSVNSDISAGTYAILPARYALLDGGYLITPQNRAVAENYSREHTLGGSYVAGKRGHYNSENLVEGDAELFLIESSDVAQKRSQVELTSADEFLAETASDILPSLPRDAGRLVIQSDAIDFNATLKGDIESPLAKGVRVDIASTQINVGARQILEDAGTLFTAEQLSAFGSESLLLGGIRSEFDGVLQIESAANNITLKDTEINLPELLLVADTINVDNSRVMVLDDQANKAANDTRVDVGESGALLVSSISAFTKEISESTNTDSSLAISDDSAVSASASIVMQSGNDMAVDGDINANGGLVTISQNVLNISNDSQVDNSWTVEQLSTMNAGEFDIFASEKIEFIGDIDLAVDKISLNTPQLVNSTQTPGGVNVDSSVFQLSNGFSSAPLGAEGTLNGKLSISSDQVIISGGDVAINGFGEVNFNSTSATLIEGTGSLSSFASLFFDTPFIGLNSGATYAIEAGQNLALVTEAPSESHLDGVAGGRLDVNADSVNIDTTIQATSGVVTANARTGDVNLGDNAHIDVAGANFDFHSIESVDTPGGLVELVSQTGNVVMTEQASIDVSGSGAAAAGQLKINAINGAATLSDNLHARHGDEANGGTLMVSANSITGGIGEQGTTLTQAGFTNKQHWRLGQGDITLSEDQYIAAKDIQLTADDGNVNIDGSINSDQFNGDIITINASDSVSIGETAVLNVDGGSKSDIKVKAGNRISIASGAQLSGERIEKPRGEYRKSTIELETHWKGDAVLPELNADLSSFDKVDVFLTRIFEHDSITSQTIFDDWATLSSELDFASNANIEAQWQGWLSEANALLPNDVSLRPGMELKSAGGVNIAQDVDLLGFRVNDEAGRLILRAAENIDIEASITDGLLKGQGFSLAEGVGFDTLSADESWDLFFVSGADLDSSSVFNVQNSQAFDITLKHSALTESQYDGSSATSFITVSTGTGDIGMFSSGNLNLNGGNGISSRIFTAGQSIKDQQFNDDAGLLLDIDHFFSGDYGINGGDIHLYTEGDINSVVTDQIVTNWLALYGSVDGDPGLQQLPTIRAVKHGAFNQDVGALGGGDISVHAGGVVRDLDLSTPVSIKHSGDAIFNLSDGLVESSGNVYEKLGYGNTSIEASSLLGGTFYSANGNLDIQAFDEIVRSNRNSGEQYYRGLTIIGEDVKTTVNSRNGVELDMVINATALSNPSFGAANLNAPTSFISGFDSTMDIVALSEDVTYFSSVRGDVDWETFTGHDQVQFKGTYEIATALLPAKVRMVAATGSLNIANNIFITPSAANDVSLLAKEDVNFQLVNNERMVIADARDSRFPTISSITNGIAEDFGKSGLPDVLDIFAGRSTYVFSDGSLRKDSTGVFNVLTSEGSINTQNISGDTSNVLQYPIFSTLPTNFRAAGNINELNIQIQHVRESDVSTVIAGESIVYELVKDANNELGISKGGIEVVGPGSLVVLAGENIDLGTSAGIRSTGNLESPSLADKGADIIAGAGFGDNLNDANHLDDAVSYYTEDRGGNMSHDYSDSLISFIDSKTNAIDFTQSKTDQLSTALLAYESLDNIAKWEFASSVLFQEFAHACELDSDDQIAMGRTAIEQIFGYELESNEVTEIQSIAASGYRNGNTNLFFSEISTEDGGNINLLNPFGSINAGLATAEGLDKTPDALGIIAQSTGNINGYTYNDFTVNTSRVFALDGGNISLWAERGNIDAGKGERTAISIPPPTVLIDDDGSFVIEFSGAVSGSGIKNAVYTPGLAGGEACFVVPNGFVDAGEAGIQSAGRVRIAAQEVKNADFISAAGGVDLPATTVTVTIPAGFNGASAATDSATASASESASKESTQSESLAQNAFAWLEVFVVGFGECEDPSSSNPECIQ